LAAASRSPTSNINNSFGIWDAIRRWLSYDPQLVPVGGGGVRSLGGARQFTGSSLTGNSGSILALSTTANVFSTIGTDPSLPSTSTAAVNTGTINYYKVGNSTLTFPGTTSNYEPAMQSSTRGPSS